MKIKFCKKVLLIIYCLIVILFKNFKILAHNYFYVAQSSYEIPIANFEEYQQEWLRNELITKPYKIYNINVHDIITNFNNFNIDKMEYYKWFNNKQLNELMMEENAYSKTNPLVCYFQYRDNPFDIKCPTNINEYQSQKLLDNQIAIKKLFIFYDKEEVTTNIDININTMLINVKHLEDESQRIKDEFLTQQQISQKNKLEESLNNTNVLNINILPIKEFIYEQTIKVEKQRNSYVEKLTSTFIEKSQVDFKDIKDLLNIIEKSLLYNILQKNNKDFYHLEFKNYNKKQITYLLCDSNTPQEDIDQFMRSKKLVPKKAITIDNTITTILETEDTNYTIRCTKIQNILNDDYEQKLNELKKKTVIKSDVQLNTLKYVDTNIFIKNKEKIKTTETNNFLTNYVKQEAVLYDYNGNEYTYIKTTKTIFWVNIAITYIFKFNEKQKDILFLEFKRNNSELSFEQPTKPPNLNI
ncbi:MAG: hypothetical protein Q2306_01535 [Phytoplasma sp.]|uniref:hypothetical protein n=1 Tax=Phytoplasma sp. TaxID=2155 RepID=UPI002B401A8A|nr:hypothetical protein [Phytoplasma sp.]WRH06570.1 MAG: hypothetical protein Q2306_01535 [Phytoplasma sp.]